MDNKKIIIVTATLLLLGAGSAFGALYTGAWSPAWSPFAASPEEVIEESLENVFSGDDLIKVSGNIYYVTEENSSNGATSFDLNIEGLIDKKNPDSQKVESNIKGKLNYIGTETELDVDIILDQKDQNVYDTYFRMNEMPLLALLGEFLSLPEGLEGQWFLAPGSEGNVTVDNYVGEFSEEDKDIEYIGEEKINGVTTYHYRVSAKSQETEDAGVENAPVDIWVGKKDQKLRRILVDTEFKQEAGSADEENSLGVEFPGLNLAEGEVDAQVRAELNFEYSGIFGEGVAIPSDAKTFQELLN